MFSSHRSQTAGWVCALISKKMGFQRAVPVGSGSSNRCELRPVGTRFCTAKSSVLYLLRPLTAERCCRVWAGRFRWQQNGGYLQCHHNCKCALFGCRRCCEMTSCARNETVSPGEQMVYKTRRSDRYFWLLPDNPKNSFRTFFSAAFSVILARLSLSRKCFAVSVSGCSSPSSKPYL